MLTFARKIFAFSLLAVLLSLASGCVARKMVYGFLDTLVYRSIDGYFDVDGKQKSFLQAKLEEVHAWHATQELPRYVEDLRGIENRAADGLDRADVDWVYERVESARERLTARVLDDALTFLGTVSPQQVAEMEEANAKRNAKREKVLAKNEVDYIEHRSDAIAKNVKTWMGSLSENQRELIVRHARSRLAADQQRFAATKLSQSRLATALREGATRGAVRAALLAGMSSFSPEKNPHQASLRDLFVELAASATPEQKAHFLKEVQAWRADFEELSRTHRQASLSRSSGSVLSSNVSPH
ncbi:MAG: hypothetical protein IOD12_02125 [Silvanigrellales bacterium]|nr:hypothetical protein [Silvanigrellales bacterium]